MSEQNVQEAEFELVDFEPVPKRDEDFDPEFEEEPEPAPMLMIAGPGQARETLPATVLVQLPSRMQVTLKPEYLGHDLKTVIFQPGQDIGPEACPIATLKVAIEYGVRQLMQDRMARGATQHEKVELLRDGLRRFRLGTIGLRKNGIPGTKTSNDPLRKLVLTDPTFRAVIEKMASRTATKPKAKSDEKTKAAWAHAVNEAVTTTVELKRAALQELFAENQRRSAEFAALLADF